MSATMLTTSTFRPQTALLSRPACATSAFTAKAPRRAALQVVAIGGINDPEKTKANKEKKASEGQWAEPHNKNPLEKKSLVRGDPGRAADQESIGNPAEGAKEAIEGATEAAKEALEDAKKKISGE